MALDIEAATCQGLASTGARPCTPKPASGRVPRTVRDPPFSSNCSFRAAFAAYRCLGNNAATIPSNGSHAMA